MLISSKKEKEKDVGRGERRKDTAEGTTNTTSEAAEEGVAKHPDRNTAVPVQTTTAHVPPPETQVTPLAARNRNYVASSSSLIDGINKPSLPSTPLLRTGLGGDTASSIFSTLLQLARVLIKQSVVANPPAIL